MTRRTLILAVAGAGVASAAAAQGVAPSTIGQLNVPLTVVVTAIIAAFGAGGTWLVLHKRVDVVEGKVAAIEVELDAKASNEEMNRQRDNIGAVYRKLDEMTQTIHKNHVDQLTETHTAMRTLSVELRASIENATLERRRKPRDE